MQWFRQCGVPDDNARPVLCAEMSCSTYENKNTLEEAFVIAVYLYNATVRHTDRMHRRGLGNLLVELWGEWADTVLLKE